MHSADHSLNTVDLETLRRLEETLWRSETRHNNELMETLFAKDFLEFGRSGKIYARSDMFLTYGSNRTINATLPLPDFRARHLSDDIIQVTYVSENTRNGEVERANRSSIWSRNRDGWELRFHQGTAV